MFPGNYNTGAARCRRHAYSRSHVPVTAGVFQKYQRGRGRALQHCQERDLGAPGNCHNARARRNRGKQLENLGRHFRGALSQDFRQVWSQGIGEEAQRFGVRCNRFQDNRAETQGML